jgi:hypothetical protein
MAQKKKKDPWGSASSNPFNAPNETSASAIPPGLIPSPEERARNRRNNYEKGLREGFVMAEDGSMVPRSYYGGGGGRGGGSRNPHGNVGGRGGGGGPCKPGYAMAEDGTCVPDDYWDKAKGKTSRNAYTGAPIVW